MGFSERVKAGTVLTDASSTSIGLLLPGRFISSNQLTEGLSAVIDIVAHLSEGV